MTAHLGNEPSRPLRLLPEVDLAPAHSTGSPRRRRPSPGGGAGVAGSEAGTTAMARGSRSMAPPDRTSRSLAGARRGKDSRGRRNSSLIIPQTPENGSVQPVRFPGFRAAVKKTEILLQRRAVHNYTSSDTKAETVQSEQALKSQRDTKVQLNWYRTTQANPTCCIRTVQCKVLIKVQMLIVSNCTSGTKTTLASTSQPPADEETS